jgi:hypothetical protein
VKKKRGKTHGRRFVPPIPKSVKNRSVPFWCVYFTKLALIFKISFLRAARVVMPRISARLAPLGGTKTDFFISFFDLKNGGQKK